MEINKQYKKTREKVKNTFPKWYELKCEIHDNFSKEHPINFEFINEGVSSNKIYDKIENFRRDKLTYEYMLSTYHAYDELIYMYTYSIAAEKISVELENDGDEGFSGFWKFNIRNFYFRNFIPRFWSILDYLTFMAYQLSEGELIPKTLDKEPKYISFVDFEKNFEERLKIDSKNNTGFLTLNDRKIILNSFKKPFKNITPHGKEMLKRYRDIIIHRYLPGIDEMTINSERAGSKTRSSDYGKLYSISNGIKKHDYYGIPEFKYSTLIEIAKILLVNLTNILNDFAHLEIMSYIIKNKNGK